MVLSFDNLSIDLKRHKVRHFIKYTHKEACNYPTQLGEFIEKNGFNMPRSQAFSLNINHNKR